MRLNASKYNQHWQDKTLNELGDFQRGKSRHRPRNDPALFSGGKHPLIQTGEIKEANLYITAHSTAYNDFGLAQSKLWPKNTLCITIAANIAETALLNYPMCFPDSVVGFNAYAEQSSELFMHYVFTYIRRAIQNSATGSIQDNINIEYLTSLKFKIPVKNYQDKIAAVFSALDAKIDCNNRINAELEAMAKTLYDYWFVQFDFPDANGKPYKSSGGKMVYNPALKREIPEGWHDAVVADILDKTPSSTKILNKEILDTGVIPVIDQSQSYICGFTDEKSSLIVPKQPHVVFGDHTRVVKLVNFSYARGADGTQILVSKDMRMPGYLLHQVVSDIDLSSYGYARHYKFLKESKIILPNQTNAQKYQAVVTPWLEKTRESIFENLELARLRDWLLPLLMNGQVTVA